MVSTGYRPIVDDLARLYAEDDRPWRVGFSGGKDSTLVASVVSDWKAASRLSACPAQAGRHELPEESAAEKGLRPDTLRRLLGKMDEFSESHKAFGLPDDLAESGETFRN
jgi:DNA sulfur modification protein DndC